LLPTIKERVEKLSNSCATNFNDVSHEDTNDRFSQKNKTYREALLNGK